ncbi:MAG: hypothetical protein JFR38_07955 [Muribaculaceae bacterium]|nr:hypothetical protein [Muribaculaceae bacterium]
MKKLILASALCCAFTAGAADITILEERTLPDGTTIQVVQDAAGRIYKQRPGAAAPVKAEAREAAEGTVRTFYEGFEAFEESYGLNWIPAEWTKICSEAHNPTPEQLSHNINNTWYVYYSSAMYQDYTTDGDKEAFIHFGYSGDYGCSDAAQDEWLVTPAIKLASEETLHFILQSDFSEIYNFDYFSYDTYSYSKREVFSNFQVMITTDDGDNWQKIYDLEADQVSKLTDRNIMGGNGITLRNYDIDLAEFAGKTVKIGFRYLRCAGWGGNSMILDGVTIDHPESASITDITTGDDAAPVYYNLQGVRIDTPTPGTVCIRRTGEKSEKVLVK